MTTRHDDALKLGARASGQPGAEGQSSRLTKVSEIADHVRALASPGLPSLLALYMGADFKLLDTEILGRRNAGECGLEPMRIIARARKLGAIGFVLVHHDPARRAGPSAEELKVTREFRRLGEDLDTYLLHHLIVGDGRVREVSA